MSLHWLEARRAGAPDTWSYDHIRFHDLIIDGSLAGYVREDKRPGHGFTPMLANGLARFPTQSTLEDAKQLIVAHFVSLKLGELS